MTCTCQRDHTGELIPTGCPVHSQKLYQLGPDWMADEELTNMRKAHRHGIANGFTLQDQGAIGSLTTREVWVGWAWVAGPCVVLVVWWLV